MSCTHNYSVCRLPQVFIKLEFTEYTVRENIGSENFALKVCAVTPDVAFPVPVSFNTTNGTARSKPIAKLTSYCLVKRLMSRHTMGTLSLMG